MDGTLDTHMSHLCLPKPRKPNILRVQPVIYDHVAASHSVNNRICIMQKVTKQQAEGHKLAQYQLSN